MDKSLRSWMGPSTEAVDCFWVVGLVTDLNVKTCATKLLGGHDFLFVLWADCLEPI